MSLTRILAKKVLESCTKRNNIHSVQRQIFVCTMLRDPLQNPPCFLKNRQTKATTCQYYLNGHSNFSTESSTDTGSKEHIESLVNNNAVVVFMKGVPDQPQCGFSNAVVQILRMHGVEYDAHNVLADENLRAGIKTYSDWPTIPQIYLKGEFVGGCDILLQMHQSGDFIEELKAAGIRSALLDKESE
uniref:Glutaredoxin-related protein 5, mitochondrial n=1 Tax=Phallusia mammillata TaxID=59560 RepID=A0A6F9DDM5_9ASCI|nr:glutaredoxin-related protein 5, mitochondrial-like [Phallusia mammillata]